MYKEFIKPCRINHYSFGNSGNFKYLVGNNCSCEIRPNSKRETFSIKSTVDTVDKIASNNIRLAKELYPDDKKMFELIDNWKKQNEILNNQTM